MATQTRKMVELPWGDTVLGVPVPSGWRMLGSFAPSAQQASNDPQELCRQALAQPIGAASLATRDLRGKRVLIVVDDQSRPTPVRHFFRSVCDALMQAGASPADIEVLFALGVHRPMTVQDAQAKIGAGNLAAHRWHNHDCYDRAQLVHFGKTSRGTTVFLNRRLTEVDLIVPLGVIEPHLLQGFSGGYKMLLPGCAGAQTIGENHLQGLTGDGFNYVGVSPDRSPMRLDLEEGAEMLHKEVFIVNATLNGKGVLTNFFCGCPRRAFRAGAAFVRQMTEVSLPEPADIIIANSYPYDSDLRQGMKCFGNTLYGVRPGGLVLGFLYCRGGRGDLPLPSWTVPYAVLRSLTRLFGVKVVCALRDMLPGRGPIEGHFLTHFGLRMLNRNHLWFFSEKLEPNTGTRLGALRQFGSVEAMISAAVRKVGTKASCAVFPSGGATYIAAPEPGGSSRS